MVQVTLWKGGPSQTAPPLSGAGLVQLRVLRCQPLPQRTLHSDHSVQDDHPPLTEEEGQADGPNAHGDPILYLLF